MLKKETGKNTPGTYPLLSYINGQKQVLGTNHSVREIAYELGFDYPQYFSKVFKKKTGMSPAEYRKLS